MRTPEMFDNNRLVCPADRKYEVDPCIGTKTGRHNCIGAIGRERNLTKQMTRMGSSTRVATDSEFREKKHTNRCSRLRNFDDEGHSRVTMTPENKGGDANKDVYRYAILEYLTASSEPSGTRSLTPLQRAD